MRYCYGFSLIITLLSVTNNIYTQKRDFSVLFYNTENCFDCFDDTTNNGDDEYLPSSIKHWTFNRYKDKLNNIAKTIIAAGEWNPPVLIGLCEIENETVMKQLIAWTGLGNMNYRYIHYESRDRRGIDVALLYSKDRFDPMESKPVHIELGDNRHTRDILLVKGVIDHTDTIFAIVNHWPSRYGGALTSEPSRMSASKTLCFICDSLRGENPDAKIIVMGDFNDTPEDKSIHTIVNNDFINLSHNSKKIEGTNKYRYQWELIDQILISGEYYLDLQGMDVKSEFKIIDLPFLLESDPSYLGVKPYRTYQGPIYKGGFSDHLPVMVTFKYSK